MPHSPESSATHAARTARPDPRLAALPLPPLDTALPPLTIIPRAPGAPVPAMSERMVTAMALRQPMAGHTTRTQRFREVGTAPEHASPRAFLRARQHARDLAVFARSRDALRAKYAQYGADKPVDVDAPDQTDASGTDTAR